MRYFCIRMNDLSFPSEGRYEAFAHYICWAHSWYKHIPLFEGAEFTFFLSKAAGGEFSEEKPRLHYGWKTRQEYWTRYGHLDYVFQFLGDKTIYRDVSPIFVECPKMPDACTVKLYPFMSDDWNAQQVLSHLIETEYLEQLEAENSHPHRQSLLDWFNLRQKYDELWSSFTSSERDQVSRLDEVDTVADISQNVAEFLKVRQQMNERYWKLQAGEYRKIQDALRHLREASMQGIPVWH